MCFLNVISPIQIWAVELAPDETEAESKLLEATELGLNLGHQPKLTDLRPGC